MMRRFLVLIVCIVPLAEAQQTAPPKLQSIFDSDFRQDHRSDYAIKGEADWKPGVLILQPGTKIDRKVAADGWAELNLQLADMPADDQSPLQVRLWFLLERTVDCFVEFASGGSGDTTLAVRLYRFDKDGETSRARLVRSAETRSDARLAVSYRHGLVTVRVGGRDVLKGYLQTQQRWVGGCGIEASQRTSIAGFTARGARIDEPPETPERKRQSAGLTRLNEEMVDLYRKRDFEKAVEVGEQVIRLSALLDGEAHPDHAGVLYNLANAYKALGRYEESMQLAKRALRICEANVGARHPEHANQLFTLGALHFDTGDYREAERLYREANEIDREVLGDANFDTVASTVSLALIFETIDDFPSAEALYRRALDNLDRKHRSYPALLNNVARLYHRMGLYERAEPMFRECLRLDPNSTPGLNNLALLYSEMGDLQRAEPLYVRSAELVEKAVGKEHPRYAFSLIGLGKLRREQGRLDEAKKLFQEAQAIWAARVGTEHPNYGTALVHLARLAEQQNDLEEAQRLREQCLAINRAAIGETGVTYARDLRSLASVLLRLGDRKETQRLCQEAVEVAERTVGRDHGAYANALADLAVTVSETGQYTRAEALFDEAMRVRRRVIDQAAPVQSERQQKAMEGTYRNPWGARIANALDAPEHDRVPLLNSFWEWKGAVTRRQQAYRAAAGTPELQSSFSELRRLTRYLSTLMRNRPSQPDSTAPPEQQQSYAQQHKRWETRFQSLSVEREKLESAIAAGSEVYAKRSASITVSDAQSLIDERTAIVDLVEYRHPSMSGTRRLLVPRYAAFVVRRDRPPVLVGLASFSESAGAVDALRRQVAGLAPVQTSATSEPGQVLRTLLWDPIEAHLDGIESIILSPDTQLNTLPFAALPGRQAGTYLIEDYRLTYLPYANLLPGWSDTDVQESDHRGLLLVGDVDYDAADGSSNRSEAARSPELIAEAHRLRGLRSGEADKWRQLPGFRAELETVTRLYRERFGAAGPMLVLSGNEAREDAVLERGTEFDTLHLITHGFFADPTVKSVEAVEQSAALLSETSPAKDSLYGKWLPGLLSGVVLAGANRPSSDTVAEDGILRASEIETSSLQGVDLVVLSACETGLGAVAGGEGLTGLQRAFQIAGVRSVIASLWKVDDRATQELMRRFYSNLWLRKMNKTDALREAQLWMLRHPMELKAMGVEDALTRGIPRKVAAAGDTAKAGHERTAPYYWAAFQLSGDWR